MFTSLGTAIGVQIQTDILYSIIRKAVCGVYNAKHVRNMFDIVHLVGSLERWNGLALIFVKGGGDDITVSKLDLVLANVLLP